MNIIQGRGVFGAIAIGRLLFWGRSEIQVNCRKIDDTEAETARFENAKSKAISMLDGLYERALKEVGEAEAQIFDIHRMLIEDEDYNEAVLGIIETQSVNAEYAVAQTSDSFAAMFGNMEDEYMRARSADIRDVSDRIIAVLTGRDGAAALPEGEFIICAEDLSPSETVTLDRDRVLAFVTKFGSTNSHTAILARTMSIPAVIGAEGLSPELDGKLAAVDGCTGKVYIEPDKETLGMLKEKLEAQQKKQELLSRLKGKENVTLDGRKIDIYANIGGTKDIEAVLLNDAGGIGLFRSEFLYLESDDFPDEQIQFLAYKSVLESMSGKRVIIRTMDIGADKQIDYFGLDSEENPALGMRAIRICLTRPEIFRTQLRALLRASVYGKLAIMFPMIISVEEIREIKEIIESVKSELTADGFSYSENIEIGIMIETPAAAVISDLLASEVDFFSIGTNDLTQYTLAADRQNPKLERFCNTHHEAVLRLIEYAAQSAHQNGKWIGICGELAADEALTEQFLRMGIDELSVSPAYVLPLRDRVRGLNLGEDKR